MYTTSADGETWSEVIDIFSIAQRRLGESAATRPSLMVDRYNNLHATFTDYFGMYYSAAPPGSARYATAWFSPRELGSGELVYFSQMRTDRRGRIHFVFTENLPALTCPICYRVFYRYSEDDGLTWSQPVDVSRLNTGSAKPQLLVDREDNLHVVWEAGVGGSLGQLTPPTSVKYAASYDGGVSWQAPIEFSARITDTTTSEARSIAIGMDGRDQLVSVWLGLPEDRIYYQLSGDRGRSWSSPQLIANLWGGNTVFGTLLDSYAMAADAAGHVHLLLVGRTDAEQKSLDVLHLVWSGTNWSVPTSIVNLVGDVPEWPRLAIGNGNQLHAAWYVRNKEAVFGSDTARANYTVWYSHSQADAPLVPATPLPMPTSVPSPKPQETTPPSSQTASATPTAVSMGILTSEYPDNIAYTETGYVIILARSLIPAALLTGLIFLIRTWRR